MTTAFRVMAAGAIVAILAAACGRAAGPAGLVERAGVAMGSELRLTAAATDDGATRAAFDAVFQEFDRLDALLSVWRPGSDVLRINAAAGERPVAVGADTRAVL